MQYRLLLLVPAVLLSACGGSNHAAATHSLSHKHHIPGVLVGTVPPGTSVPVHKGAHASAPHGTAVSLPSLPTKKPTAIPAADYTAIIRGRVTIAHSGAPVAGATITLGSNLRRAVTNSAGRYHLSFPAGPSVPIVVAAKGTTGAIAAGALKAHSTITLNFKLNKKAAGKPGLPVPPIIFKNP